MEMGKCRKKEAFPQKSIKRLFPPEKRREIIGYSKLRAKYPG
jgi:hypothetical protein